MKLVPSFYAGFHHFLISASKGMTISDWVSSQEEIINDGVEIHSDSSKQVKWVSFRTVEEAIEFRLKYES